MAFQAKKIFPIDLEPRKAVGISLPFSGEAVFNQTYQTKDAIKTNIINYFLTGVGERYLNVKMGTSLRNLLFNPYSNELEESIEDEIRESIRRYFPRIVIKSIDITPSPEYNTISLYIKYYISETGIEDELLINFEQ